MTNQDVMELCHIFSHRVDYWVEQEFHRFVTELSVDWDLCLEGFFLHFRSQLKRHTSHSKYLNVLCSILNFNTTLFKKVYVQFVFPKSIKYRIFKNHSKRIIYLDAKDNDGKTALMVAKQSGFQDIVMLIKAKLT